MKNHLSYIEHTGVVTSITEGLAKVQIVQLSACSSCHAKGACSATDSAEKEVDAFVGNQSVHVGQEVMVTGRSVLGIQAVLIAYLLPFVLMLVTLLVTMNYSQSEGLSAALAIGILFPFYFVLYLFRNKLKKNFSFFIKQIIL